MGLKVKEGLGEFLLSQATNKSQQGIEPNNIGSERNNGKRRNVEQKSPPVECQQTYCSVSFFVKYSLEELLGFVTCKDHFLHRTFKYRC